MMGRVRRTFTRTPAAQTAQTFYKFSMENVRCSCRAVGSIASKEKKKLPSQMYAFVRPSAAKWNGYCSIALKDKNNFHFVSSSTFFSFASRFSRPVQFFSSFFFFFSFSSVTQFESITLKRVRRASARWTFRPFYFIISFRAELVMCVRCVFVSMVSALLLLKTRLFRSVYCSSCVRV